MKQLPTLLAFLWPLALGSALVVPQDKQPGPAALVNSIGMKLVLIPAGEFLMGSPDSDKDALDDEKPQHRVRITRPFYMGVYEVTQEEYERVMGVNSSFFSPTGKGKDRVAGLNTKRFPAEQVRWVDAVEFCRRLSERPEEKKANRNYRLPTEAEWEYACRAGTRTAFHVGDALSSRQANFNGNHPHGGATKGSFLVRTTEVGSYPANAFGLHDMHGNVWEWCADWYGRNYYRESPTDDPPGPRTGSARVIRGGEWYADGRDCRSAFRYAEMPEGIFYVMGFRVVMQVGHGGPVPPITPLVQKPEKEPAIREIAPELLVGEDWPQFRGPRNDGTWKGPALPEKWPAGGPTVIWRQEIGGGYAGVVASKGRVYTLDFLEDGSGSGGKGAGAKEGASAKPQATMVWLGEGDRAVILNSDGELILARLNVTGYHEQARASIIGPTWAHPAYAGSCIYARNDRELVCVLLREQR